ncbi:ribonuclease E, partial [Vibrio parahaemolyticus]|nr:ribonuclease E [Vibrio parahaemolyticus]
DLISYVIPKKLEARKESEGKEPADVDVKPKQMGDPVLKGFAAPSQTAPAPAAKPAPEAKKKEQNVEQEEKPGLFSRLFKALGSFLFGGSEETKEEQKPQEEKKPNRDNR